MQPPAPASLPQLPPAAAFPCSQRPPARMWTCPRQAMRPVHSSWQGMHPWSSVQAGSGLHRTTRLMAPGTAAVVAAVATGCARFCAS